MADLGHELKGAGMDLDGPTCVPCGEEASTPGQRRGVGSVGRTEHRLIAGAAGAELPGQTIPQAFARGLDRTRLPGEASDGCAAGTRFERETAGGAPVEDPVFHRRAVLGTQ